MKRLALLFLLLPGFSAGQKIPSPRDIDASFGIPVPKDTLMAIRTSPQFESARRRHAWRVFEAITTHASRHLPIWFTWCTKQEIFQGQAYCAGNAGGDGRDNPFEPSAPKTRKFEDSQVVSSTYFNPAA